MRQNDRKALVVGCGSIGARHAAILSGMNFDVACVTHRTDVQFPVFTDTEQALDRFKPEVVLIATRTAEHYKNYCELASAGYAGLILMEKPLFAGPHEILPQCPGQVFVGYNLRYHPVVQQIRRCLSGRKIFAMQFAVGQYLPQWRPGTDYRQCYSARVAEGGGVLRDLSHELDLAQWLCGPLTKVSAIISHNANLDIETEDTADILAVGAQCPSVTIHLDYQSLFAQRSIIIQADGLSLHGDLIHNTLRTQECEMPFAVNRDLTYRAQWQDILEQEHPIACTLQEALGIVNMIQLIENAAKNQRWEFI